MKTKKIRILALLLVGLVLLPNIVSCGGREYKFDPGFFEINTDNYDEYLTIDIEEGKKDFSQARDGFAVEYEIKSQKNLQYMDCYITVKFTVNENSVTERISLSDEGMARGSVLVEFAKTYNIEYSYEITDVSGTVYDNGFGEGPSYNAYIEYNNIRYKVWKGNNWRPEFRLRNNTKTLYFTDTIYTESGMPVKFHATLMFNIWGDDSSFDKVTTLIFDGSLKYSDFVGMGWTNAYTVMPNLQTIYIKNLVDDYDDSELDLSNMRLPDCGVDFYLGGDVEDIAEVLSEVDFVNSINSADDLDLNNYEKDNKR